MAGCGEERPQGITCLAQARCEIAAAVPGLSSAGCQRSQRRRVTSCGKTDALGERRLRLLPSQIWFLFSGEGPAALIIKLTCALLTSAFTKGFRACSVPAGVLSSACCWCESRLAALFQLSSGSLLIAKLCCRQKQRFLYGSVPIISLNLHRKTCFRME